MKLKNLHLKGISINHLLSALAASAAFAVSSASAVTDTWIAASGTGNWDTTSLNWNDGTTAGVAFTNGNDVVFTNAAGGTITVVSTVSPASTLFNSGSANYTVSGGNISGTGTLTKSGGGELQLRNVSSFTGKTIVNDGTLRLFNSGGLTNAGVSGPLGAPVGANATIDLFNNSNFQTGGAEPRLNQSTDRKLNLAGIGAGTVSIRVNDNDTRFTFGSVTATGTGAKTLRLFMGNSGNGDRESLIFTGGIADSSDGSPTSLNISFNTINTEHLSLVGTNTFTGPISASNANSGASASTLTVGGLYTGPNAANGLATENIRGTGSLGGGNYPGAISLGSKTILNYRSTNNQTLAGVISGAGAVTLDGLSTVTLTNSNTYTGDTTIGSGSTLTLPNGAGLTLAVTNSGSNKVTGAGTATLNGAFTLDLSAVTSGTGSWSLVDATNKSFGATFSVVGFTQAADVWTFVSGPKTWTFTEATGVLNLTSTAVFSSFGIPGYAGVIDNNGLTIRLIVPRNTNLATLAPTYTVASGSVNQTSGAPPSPTFAAANPVTYTITDGTTVINYAVTVVPATEIINLRVSNGTSVPEVDLEGPAGPPVPGTQIWNQVTALPALSASGLRDSVGALTTIGFSATSLEAADDWGITVPFKLLSRSARVFSNAAGNSGFFTISGLTPNTYFDLWIASSHINGSGLGTWSTTNTNSTGSIIPVDNTGQSSNGSTWVAGVNYVRFQNVKVSASGNITMTVKNSVGPFDSRVGFSGFQLIPAVAPPLSEYATWSSAYLPGADVSNPAADNDGDGLTNQQEYAFGLNPTLGSSVNPITVPLDKTNGLFTYTRHATPASSGLTYAVQTSTDLVTWTTDVGATQSTIGTVGGVQTVQVTLSAAIPLTAPTIFVRVKATP